MHKNGFLLLLSILLGAEMLYAQPALVSSRIRVVARFASVDASVDCDNFPLGDSDFVWHFIATDNTLGYTNNSPVATDFMGAFNYGYRNENNGPYSFSPGDATVNAGWDPADGRFFERSYCAADVPTAINLRWRAYENDAVDNYSTGSNPDGSTGIQTVALAVPTTTGTNIQTLSATSSDAGCPQSYNLSISVERLDFWAAAPAAVSICQGSEYNWYGQSLTVAGTYTHTLTAQNGCDSILSLELSVLPPVTASLGIVSDAFNNTACVGATVVFTAAPQQAGPNPGYQWFVNGVPQASNTATFATNTLNHSDVVLCIMTPDTACVTDSTVSSNPIVMSITPCGSTTSVQNQTPVWEAFPNPSKGQLRIQGERLPERLLLFDHTGRQVGTWSAAGAQRLELDLEHLPSGIYWLQGIDAENSRSLKLVLMRD